MIDHDKPRITPTDPTLDHASRCQDSVPVPAPTSAQRPGRAEAKLVALAGGEARSESAEAPARVSPNGSAEASVGTEPARVAGGLTPQDSGAVELAEAPSPLEESRTLDFPPWLLRLGMQIRQGRLLGYERNGRSRGGKATAPSGNGAGASGASERAASGTSTSGCSPGAKATQPELPSNLPKATGAPRPGGQESGPAQGTQGPSPERVARASRPSWRRPGTLAGPWGPAQSEAPVQYGPLVIPNRSYRWHLAGVVVALAALTGSIVALSVLFTPAPEGGSLAGHRERLSSATLAQRSERRILPAASGPAAPNPAPSPAMDAPLSTLGPRPESVEVTSSVGRSTAKAQGSALAARVSAGSAGATGSNPLSSSLAPPPASSEAANRRAEAAPRPLDPTPWTADAANPVAAQASAVPVPADTVSSRYGHMRKGKPF